MPTKIKSYKYKIICDHPSCNNQFETNKEIKRFCSHICANRWHSIERNRLGKVKKRNKPNPQRYCKVCNIPIPKGKHYCDEHRLERKKESKKHRRVEDPKIKPITKEEEGLLIKCVNELQIYSSKNIVNYLKDLGIKRSQAFIWKHLKRLGIQKENISQIEFEKYWKEFREERNKQIIEWGFTIIQNNTKASGIKIECNHCKTLFNYPSIKNQKGKCFKCEIQKRKDEKERIKSENLDKINSAKNKEYTERIERLKEFIYNKKEEDIKEYQSWNNTPIYKEFLWYRSNNNKEYRDKELDYKIDRINYYVYRTGVKCPDKPIKKGYKICNRCREEKPASEFTGRGERNTCKPCAKEYRREFLLEDEVKRTREKYNNDPLFKLDSLVRAYVYGALKGRLKTKRTKEILGIEWYEFKQYIEERFESWMSWDNHGIGEGKWALQHIIPREFANNENEIYLINYYKNFIPMCAIQNGILKNRVIEEQMNEWHKENKGIQKILKRNKDKIIKENVFKTQYQITEIKPNKQTEQKITKWFAF